VDTAAKKMLRGEIVKFFARGGFFWGEDLLFGKLRFSYKEENDACMKIFP
jgi:hypothetical protein